MNDEALRIEGGTTSMPSGVWMFFASVFIAGFGGLVRSLNCDAFSWWSLLKRVVTAMFVGGLMHLVLVHFGVSQSLQCALSGGCGYAAIELLNAFGPTVVRFANRKLGLREARDEE